MNTTDKPSPAVKKARQRLLDKIRDDWTFNFPTSSPPQPPPVESSNNAIGSPSVPLEPTLAAVDLSTLDLSTVTEWRERTYASSDPSSDDSSPDTNRRSSIPVPAPIPSKPKPPGPSPKSPATKANNNDSDDEMDALFPTEHLQRPAAKKAARRATTPARREGPEAVETRKLARKRKRMARLEEEMQWNEGLRFWEARRDAWCCARRVERGALAAAAAGGDAVAGAEEHGRSVSAVLWGDGAAGAGDSTAESRTGYGDDEARGREDDRAQTTLLPVAPPLLPPTDPTRASITPALYPSLYAKVVTQSLTPSIPLNLSHVVPAIVAGWKAAGEWPPKGAAAGSGVSANTNAAGNGTGTVNRDGAGSRSGGAARGVRGGGSGARPLTGVLSQEGGGLETYLSGAGRRLMRRHRRGGDKEKEKENEREEEGVGAGGGGGMLKGVHAKVGKVLRFSLSGSAGGPGSTTAAGEEKG